MLELLLEPLTIGVFQQPRDQDLLHRSWLVPVLCKHRSIGERVGHYSLCPLGAVGASTLLPFLESTHGASEVEQHPFLGISLQLFLAIDVPYLLHDLSQQAQLKLLPTYILLLPDGDIGLNHLVSSSSEIVPFL